MRNSVSPFFIQFGRRNTSHSQEQQNRMSYIFHPFHQINPALALRSTQMSLTTRLPQSGKVRDGHCSEHYIIPEELRYGFSFSFLLLSLCLVALLPQLKDSLQLSSFSPPQFSRHFSGSCRFDLSSLTSYSYSTPHIAKQT